MTRPSSSIARHAAVRDVTERGLPIADVALAQGVKPGTVYRWMRDAGRPARPVDPEGRCLRGHDATHRVARADRDTTRCSECHREDNRKDSLA